MAVLLGFSANVQGTEYPAAIFKLDRGEGYCWPGDHPTEGFLTVFDLVSAERHAFSGSWEAHGSRHKSGRRHQTVVSAGRKVHLGADQDLAVEDISAWSSLRSVTVPLTQPFEFWPIKHPAWTAMWAKIKSAHILTRDDFGEDVDGVTLHGYICRHDRLDDLISTWRLMCARSWTARDQDFDLVVLLECVRIPTPKGR